jgi:alkylation response protein AidB-like acyl-CoA dehydrogenase
MTVAPSPDRTWQFSPELVALREEVRGFIAEELAEGRFTPQTDAWLSGFDPGFSKRLADRGWVGMTIPTQHGGHGRTEFERFVVLEELLAAGAPVAAHWISDRQMAPSILRNGTEMQCSTYLPGIVRGERFFSIGMSESDSGSDLASIRTKATECADGWRISGSKIWTSGAQYATNLLVLVRTSEEKDRHVGLSQLIVDLPHPDIHVIPIRTIDGGQHFNEVLFDDAVVPSTALLGNLGDGWRQVTAELGNERSGPERIMSTLPLVCAWAHSATAQRDPMARLELGRMVSHLTALRQMSMSVAQQLADGESPSDAAAMVKDLGTTYESEIVNVVRTLAGVEPDQNGDRFSVLLANALMHTPFFTLRGGTTEMLRSIVARSMGG